MDLLTIILISVGLAMDCFAVSIAHGMGVDKKRKALGWYGPWLMALWFGFFQGGMPLIGYFAGTVFSSFFARFAPWIALGLLAFIGGKMVWESVNEDANENANGCADFGLKHITLMAIATSIDALATGVIFIPYPEKVWLGVGVIALGSWLFSLMGYLIGFFVGKRFHFNVALLGGLILIGIGLKIWIEGVFL